jgi:4-amino-4-deoxy-L-arabinose transferase-like glycosyltransferase
VTASRAKALLLETVPLLLLLLALSARSLLLSQRHPVAIYDEVGYLADAHQFAAKGTLGTAACYLRGECRGDNRNPLYEMGLARAMSGGPGDLAAGKLVTLATALLLVLVVFGFSRAIWGRDVALAAACVPALSWAAASLSQTILADVLYSALFFAALAVLIKWESRREGWLAFGLLAGLAYLAKASGHFLLLSAVALAAWRFRRGASALPEHLCALGGFLLGAGLVIVRNLRVWGRPFYNINAKVIWLDDWSTTWTFAAKPELWQKVGLLPYLRHHNLADMAGRLADGAAKITQMLFTVAGPEPMAFLGGVAGPIICGAAAWGLWLAWKEGRRAEPVVALAAVGPLMLAHFWASAVGVNGPRFMLPVAAVLSPFAALGLRDAWRRGLAQVSVPADTRAVAVPALVGLMAAIALGGPWSGFDYDPRMLWRVPPNWQETTDWVKAHVGETGFLISEKSYYSAWDWDRDPRHLATFEVFDDALRAQADALKVGYLLLDASDPSYRQWPERLGRADAYGSLTYLGWKRVYHDSLRPSQLLIYQRP